MRLLNELKNSAHNIQTNGERNLYFVMHEYKSLMFYELLPYNIMYISEH